MNPIVVVLGLLLLPFMPYHLLINLLIVVLTLVVLKKSKLLDDRRSRRRRASFATRSCAEGVFPPELNAPNPVIQAVFHFATPPPSVAALSAVVQQSLLFFTRFRARPEFDAQGVCIGWQEAPAPEQIRVEDHITEHRVQNKAAERALVEKLSVAPIRTDRPYWELHLVTVDQEQCGSLIARIHHCIGDGLALESAFTRVFQSTDGSPVGLMSMKKESDIASQLARTAGSSRNNVTMTFNALKYLWHAGGALSKVLTLSAASGDSRLCISPPLPYKFNPARVCVRVPPLPLDRIKKVKNECACTINDVMLSLVAGMWRRYLIYRNDPALKDGQEIRMRALVPYSFPRSNQPDDPDSLHNLFCFLSADLPMNERNALERVRAGKATMDALKASPEAWLQLQVDEIASTVLPRQVTSKSLLDLYMKHSMVFTNVPGPQTKISVCGLPVSDFEAAIGNIIPQLSAVSYDGAIRFTICVDPLMISNADYLSTCFYDELVELETALNF